MITDFFLDLWITVGLWFLGLFGDYEPVPGVVTDAVDGIGSFFGQTGSMLGALDHWFPVAPFLSIALVSVLLEVVWASIRGVRKIKQLLPFQ